MTKDNKNPYATALDGLTIEDPVQSFFNFCKERENIRTDAKNLHLKTYEKMAELLHNCIIIMSLCN